jgi:hypothetical protein
MSGSTRQSTDADLFAHAGLAFGGGDMEIDAGRPMTVAEVTERAQGLTGCEDWGPDDSFREGLAVLVEAIEEMGPSEAHRHSFRRQIVHLLCQRLRMREDELGHPEVLEERIEQPVLILGVPRSGTTLTHELLALDPAARAARNWEYAAPWPAPERSTFATDPRIEKVNASWLAQRTASPELEHMLPMDANMPSECNDAKMFHFAGPNFWAWMKVPRHRTWIAERVTPGLYRTHRRILQELQWHGPRGRWTLKSPSFMGDLAPILETYPDARLVWTHRDPARTIASLASLVASLQYALLRERPDPVALGSEVRHLWVALLKRGLEQREDPRVARAIVDVSYRQLVADKAGTVAMIHERFGLAFTDEHRRAIGELEVEQPSSQYAQHRYTAEEFGIDVDEIREELADYYERFGELAA